MPRGRPSGAVQGQNRLKRLRAFELYAGGQRKAEIGRVLGVTKASVGGWARKDSWDSRLAGIAARADEAVDLVTAETIADIVVRIRAKYNQRLTELDQICTSVLSTPQTKISAIKAWFELGSKVNLDALRPASDPRNLELIQDLLPSGESDSEAAKPPTSGYPSSTHVPSPDRHDTPDSRRDSDPAPSPSPGATPGLAG